MAHHLVDLARLPACELHHIMRYGESPDFAALDGWVFRGANLLPPGKWMFPKFAKGFFTEKRGEVSQPMGYNLKVARGSLDEPWQILPEPARAVPFGFYTIGPAHVGAPRTRYPHALFFDYGKGKNGLDPSRQLRDYLVQVEPNNKDLYLGRAYYSVFGVWLGAGYFVLERLQKAPAAPPR